MNLLIKNRDDLIRNLEAKYLKYNTPKINVGDVIQISFLIKEANKERLQLLEGIIISIKNAGINTTITTRKTLQGIGVERVYLIHSPKIINIKVLKQSLVRKAKLFYLRKKHGKIARLKQKFK